MECLLPRNLQAYASGGAMNYNYTGETFNGRPVYYDVSGGGGHLGSKAMPRTCLPWLCMQPPMCRSL